VTTEYTPRWRDRDGNEFVFIAPKHYFETEREAEKHANRERDYLVGLGVVFVRVEPVTVEIRDGQRVAVGFRHLRAQAGRIGWVAVIAGPEFDKAFKIEAPLVREHGGTGEGSDNAQPETPRPAAEKMHNL